MSTSEALLGIAVFASGIPAGLQIAVLTVFAPRTATLEEPHSVRTHDLLLHHSHHNLIGVAPSVLAAACAIAALVADGVEGLAGVATIVGVAGLVGAAVVTRVRAIPVNIRIRKRLTLDTETDYAQFAPQFAATQRLRAACGVLGFFALTLALAAI